MKDMMTLKEYIAYLSTILNLPDTENVQKKITKKFERTLKNELNAWDDAKTIKIAKTKAKIFPKSTLEKVYKLNDLYLAKILQLDTEKIKKQQIENDFIFQNSKPLTKEELEYNTEVIQSANDYYNQNYKISIEEQNNVMLKALFEKFFTPLDIKQWESDKILIDNTDDINDLAYIAAQDRLNQKDGKAYYKQLNK